MNKCLLCGAVLSSNISLTFLLSLRAYRSKTICLKCQSQFQSIDLDRCCQFCGKTGTFAEGQCNDCRIWSNSATAKFRNQSLYQYNQKMHEYMHIYKFQGDYRLRKVFQAEFIKRVKESHRLVVPIPLHPMTYRKRGFNQVKGLLETLKLINVLQTRSLSKVHAQSVKDRQQRLLMKQPFKLVPGGTEKIKGRDLLVVDDVYTTGTTIRHAAQLLKTAGAHSVNGMTLAH